MSKRNICVVVTARPSYSRIKTALKAIEEHPDLELQLVVAGSALLGRYGSAIRIIEKDGFKPVEKVFNVLEGENVTVAAKTTGLGILELSTVFDNIKPDIVVTVADRYETMATAIAASYMNIPLAHIQGGEVTGNIDEKVRHAITKLADYHFVASDGARERVIKLGENPAMVYNTGCPSIDLAEEVRKKPDPDFDPFTYGGVGPGKEIFKDDYLVVLQHPVTTEYEEARSQINVTLQAIHELDIPTFWFWPNVDAGSDGTSTGIRVFRETHNDAKIHFFKNMDPMHFLQLIDNAKCLIGNSSVGIREGAYLGVPVVNIGSRQNRRDRGKNVIDVNYKQNEIMDAVLFWLHRERPASSQIYGGSQAGRSIADLLCRLDLIYSKTITY